MSRENDRLASQVLQVLTPKNELDFVRRFTLEEITGLCIALDSGNWLKKQTIGTITSIEVRRALKYLIEKKLIKTEVTCFTDRLLEEGPTLFCWLTKEGEVFLQNKR